ncbi:aminotransferase DegT [Halobacteriovorax marinus]|uniref:GDP-perosamine synthase n=1 Tax=Halobacteriovorax marinus TaxID=97084 RepID=A0A1Y5FF43_9BACT|nr:aminotransferase DegT [Halobacteriovorax marinus]
MSKNPAEEVLKIIRSVVGNRDGFVPLHEPSFRANELDYVKDCIDTGWVSSVGSYVEDFERGLEKFTGIKHAIAVVNGTAGLHAAMVVLGVKENDEVLVPAFTFVATANSVRYCGAFPHFVDSEKETMGVDPQKLRAYLKDNTEIKNFECYNKKTKRRISALMAMHTFGHPVKINELVKVCKEFHIKLIEDAAESLGSYYEGKHTGCFGELAVLSFNGNKIITTGGGGAILTNDSVLADRLKHITKTSKVSHPWEFIHDEVGFNYRLPNLNAALGCAQLEVLPSFIEKKRNLASLYQRAFENNPYVYFFNENEGTKSNYWLNTLILKEDFLGIRDEILKLTNADNLMTRPAWKLISSLSPYVSCPQMEDLSCAKYLEKAIINIPSSPYLGEI